MPMKKRMAAIYGVDYEPQVHLEQVSCRTHRDDAGRFLT
jgi:hypothetical protein